MPSLRVLASRTRLEGAVTQPDRPAGRGQRLTPSPVKKAALELGLPVHEPLRLRDFARDISGAAFDVFALAAYGRILPDELLALPRLGALNVHPSLLPKYRGATPIQTAIRNGERETGVSIMLMDTGLDTGDLIVTRPVAIEPEETYGQLHDRLAAIGAELLGDTLDLAAHGELSAHAQVGDVSITKPLTREDLLVDLNWPAQRVVNAVRALSPRPAARTDIAGETVKILSAHVDDGGRVVIDQLIAPNRGKMNGQDYLRSRGLA